MEFAEDIDNLVERLANATIQLKNAKSADERVALGNYIYALYETLEAIIYLPLGYTEKDVFGSHKNVQKYLKKTDIYHDRIINNFYDNRDYHNQLLGNIINELSYIVDGFMDNQYSCMYNSITKGEFFDVFESFLKSLKLDKDFNKFIKDVGIYAYDGGNMSAAGFLLFNPIDKASDVFIGDAGYDVRTLTYLAHEFGHVYDFSKFEGNPIDYNNYLHRSLFTEVSSVLFERLMIEYLINNDVLVKETKDMLVDRKAVYYLTLIASYIDSLLDYEILRNNKQNKYSAEHIYSLISKYVDRDIKDIIEGISDLDVKRNCIYTYGDIVSMIIKDKVDKFGFDKDMLLELFEHRGEIFSPEFLDKYEVTPENYIKGYQKELKLLEK